MAPGMPPRPMMPPVPAMQGASATTTTMTPGVPPQSMMGMGAPTFPAYSAPINGETSATSSTASSALNKSKTFSLMSQGTGTKIVHPDEDCSLEERRASLTKYVGKPNLHPAGSTVGPSRPMTSAPPVMPMPSPYPLMRPPTGYTPVTPMPAAPGGPMTSYPYRPRLP